MALGPGEKQVSTTVEVSQKTIDRPVEADLDVEADLVIVIRDSIDERVIHT